jgi:hypothetical protein
MLAQFDFTVVLDSDVQHEQAVMNLPLLKLMVQARSSKLGSSIESSWASFPHFRHQLNTGR